MAVGLAEKDKAGASEALDRAIQEIDRLRESGPGPEHGHIMNGIRLMPPTNPAAQILPIVERIAPERLAEVFWRAVALHPRIETDREDQLETSYIGYECTLLARYDREVAAALFEPMDSYLKPRPRDQASGAFLNTALMAKGCIDPRAAVALIESLTPPGQSQPVEPGRSGTALTRRETRPACRKAMDGDLALHGSPIRRLTAQRDDRSPRRVERGGHYSIFAEEYSALSSLANHIYDFTIDDFRVPPPSVQLKRLDLKGAHAVHLAHPAAACFCPTNRLGDRFPSEASWRTARDRETPAGGNDRGSEDRRFRAAGQSHWLGAGEAESPDSNSGWCQRRAHVPSRRAAELGLGRFLEFRERGHC